MTPVTPEQTAAILGLDAQGMHRNAIAYQIGVTPGQVSAVRAVAKRGKHPSDSSTDEVISDAIETTFGLERDLQRALREHIDQLEPGLTIIDGQKEQAVPSGRIDITARELLATGFRRPRQCGRRRRQTASRRRARVILGRRSSECTQAQSGIGR
jgi:hypothetical protein